MKKVNIKEKLKQINEYWKPHIVGELNGQEVKLSKFKGEFIWHHHENADELFLVLKGRMTMHLRDQIVELTEGELFIVPKGVEHKPASEEEVHLMLFEPVATLNTGNVRNEKTVEDPERI